MGGSPRLGLEEEAPVSGRNSGWGVEEAPFYELLEALSLPGELDEEEEEEEEKFIPDKPGGLVAVFCPLKLFLHTGHVSC